MEYLVRLLSILTLAFTSQQDSATQSCDMSGYEVYSNERWGKQANHNILLAHGEGVKAFRSQNLKAANIGIVVDIWKRHAMRDCQEDLALVEHGEENSFRFYLDGIFKGKYSDFILSQMEREGTMPDIKAGDMETISSPIDFYGLNVYNRVLVCADPDFSPKIKTEQTGGNFLDNGNEFYPKAVYDAINMVQNNYKLKIPIYITENGTYNCNEEVIKGKIDDLDRIKYIKGFLTYLHKAIEEGADVRGYYLWSLMDNFEWSAGFGYRFGLINVDFQTQKRLWKNSAYWYKQVIVENGFEIDSY